MKKIKVIAVTGPTASGKTSLAVQLARRLNGEVVSADSMQIYKGMDIATAKPTPDEMLGVPHHMIDFLDANENYSVARYVSDAKKCIFDIAARGKVPIVAGGTGLYIDSLLNGIDFAEMPDNTEVREALKLRMEKEGAAALLEEIREIDPETANALHENNKGRIIRALEVYALTGETMSEQKRKSLLGGSAFDPFYIYIEYANRQKLYDRIDKRVDLMMSQGLLEEAEKYITLDSALTARQAIGYKELKPYFSSECSLEAAVEALKRETRHYAKRQMTWFRRNAIGITVQPDVEDFEEKAAAYAVKFLNGGIL